MHETVVRPFLEILRPTCKEYRANAVYTFMPEHAHIVMMGYDEWSDSLRCMEMFKQKTGWWLKTHRPETEWQGGFHDHIVRGDEDFAGHISYVLNNPVRWGLVQKWEQYPFTGSIGVDLQTLLADVNYIVKVGTRA